jgi:hypothetical protein
VTLGELERINHRSRSSRLEPGETVIVYAKRTPGSTQGGATAAGEAADGYESEAGAGAAEASSDVIPSGKAAVSAVPPAG